jgi:hypothetical protein
VAIDKEKESYVVLSPLKSDGCAARTTRDMVRGVGVRVRAASAVVRAGDGARGGVGVPARERAGEVRRCWCWSADSSSESDALERQEAKRDVVVVGVLLTAYEN